MTGRGDQAMKAAVLAVLRRGPRDVVDLLEPLREKEPKLLAGHEGILHALLHLMVQRGELALASLSNRDLAQYRLPDGGGDEAPVVVPVDAASPFARTAERLTSGIRRAEDRARVAADVVAHLEALESAGESSAFGSKRTARHYLRRADRKRRSVFFAADGADGFRRFVLHEGPWITAAVVIFLVVRAFLAEVFVIPSGSMIPTLLQGDRVVVYKPGGRSMPERWTIYTFERRGTTYVKRAVGLGGESIALIAGDVYVNGKVERKPESLRTWFRVPYGSWDFVEDADLWAKVGPDAAGATTWTYAGPPLYSAAPLGVDVGQDVRLRDVYAKLVCELVPGERVDLDLRYGPADGNGSGEEEWIRLFLEAGAAGIEASTKAPLPGLPGVSFGGPHLAHAGRVELELAYVDGRVRALALGQRWELDLGIRPGYVVTPCVRVHGTRSHPVRLDLDKDLHSSGAGHLGHPPRGSDDDPLSYAFLVPEGHVFFLGDNTYFSRDSRYRRDDDQGFLGPVAVEELIGPVTFRIWPPNRIGGVR
jgi:signal peptidase I